MKGRKTPRPTHRGHHVLKEHVHDPYKLRRKLPEPTRCPQCGAAYENGRWTWNKVPLPDAHEELCQACRRINDEYPAGEVLLGGAFVAVQRDEILSLMRNVESAENAEHPLHRIMDIRDRDGRTAITTTDIHLPRALGHALERAWQGELRTHYDEEGYFVRVEWSRGE